MSDVTQAGSSFEGSSYYGKYRGVVSQNLDPESRGRLLVSVPQVLGDREVWALPCVPYAGEDKGFFSLPDTGTVVWVEFEAGDPNYPIWTGCLWKRGDLSAVDAIPQVKFWKTDKFTLRIDELLGEIKIENGAGCEIVMGPLGITIKGPQISVQTPSGREVAVDAVGVNLNKGALQVL
jgi:hypothetical protein